MKELILHTHRDGYGTDQIERTMTVGDLIDFLQELDPGEDVPFIGAGQETEFGMSEVSAEDL